MRDTFFFLVTSGYTTDIIGVVTRASKVDAGRVIIESERNIPFVDWPAL